MPSPITTLFVDVGGVLLTNSWGHTARHRAAERFDLDCDTLNRRHYAVFTLYEEGKLNLDEYLDRAVFYEDRPFSRKDFQEFMFSQSETNPQMIELVRGVKARHGLKVVAISNVGWELAAHRIEKFVLKSFIDLFVFSCFVRCRKPEADIYYMAMDIAQVTPDAVVYLEEQPMFVEVAKKLGIRVFQHLSDKFTRQSLAALDLPPEGRRTVPTGLSCPRPERETPPGAGPMAGCRGAGRSEPKANFC
jgi:putative hydrolase of the HAD superfamily